MYSRVVPPPPPIALLRSDRDHVVERVRACLDGQVVVVHGPTVEEVPAGAAILVDLPGTHRSDGAGAIVALRCDPRHAELPILALVDDGDDASFRDALGAGADDCIRLRDIRRDLSVRLAARLRAWEVRAELRRREDDLRTLVELTRSFAGTLDAGALLYDVTRRLAEALQLRRCSLVLTDAKGERATVVATSDDEAIVRRPIDLAKYPEIREALRVRRAVVVEDAERHPLLDPVKDAVSAAGMGTMAVLPLALEEEILGVLFLRAAAAEPSRSFSVRELEFAAAVANATAVALRNARSIAFIRSRVEEAEARRDAMILELAGAAAHELNQPLTSVLGYGELLQRRLDPDAPVARYAEIVVREAERMAEVVRKIGNITRHETRPYVGEKRIVDLERSAEPDEQAGRRP